jgi:hypothetical protein
VVLKMPSKLKRESAVQVREEVREMMGSRCARRVHPLQSPGEMEVRPRGVRITNVHHA